MAQMAGGAMSIAGGLRQQIREEIASHFDNLAARLDLVPREDLDQALAMIAKLRETQSALEKRLDALESGKTKKK
ncbi:MAG: accessory factor UbiK family protein [Rhodospirillales bacterium]|nr:accessory factor UbiK family protein [Rhodospirillales bacterium]